jgi:hypothetical protein
LSGHPIRAAQASATRGRDSGYLAGVDPVPHSVDHAAATLLMMAEKRVFPVLSMSAPVAWDLFMDFAEVLFTVPAIPDADGLLYQFGTYAFTGTPRFHFDLVRQFAVTDSDEYVQAHLELLFEPADDLKALKAHDEWFWRGGSSSLHDWSESVRRRPEWLVLVDRVPPTSGSTRTRPDAVDARSRHRSEPDLNTQDRAVVRRKLVRCGRDRP